MPSRPASRPIRIDPSESTHPSHAAILPGCGPYVRSWSTARVLVCMGVQPSCYSNARHALQGFLAHSQQRSGARRGCRSRQRGNALVEHTGRGAEPGRPAHPAGAKLPPFHRRSRAGKAQNPPAGRAWWAVPVSIEISIKVVCSAGSVFDCTPGAITSESWTG
jgi:hypothetical protein